MLHYKQDCTVWSSQVRSYPWYSDTLCKLGSRPSSPHPRRHQPPISAPQPRRPIRLPARAVLSYLHKVEQMHVPAQNPGDQPPVRRASQQAIQQATAPSARLTVLYPLHIQAVWGTSADGPSSGGIGNSAVISPTSARAQIPHRSAPAPSATLPPDGGPPPLWDWPRPDIMTLPRPARKKAIVVPSASQPAPAVDPPRRTSRGRGRSSARSPPALTPASPV